MSDVLWIHRSRPRSGWYELSDEARAQHRSRWTETRRDAMKAGGQHLGEFGVRGESDFSTTEVWLFPTPEAVFDHWAALTSAGYAEWFVCANSVGLRSEVAG